MGDMAAIGNYPLLPQQGKGGHGGVAAKLHLPGRGKIPQCYAAIAIENCKSGFRMFELGSNLLHHGIVQRPVRQDNTSLVAAKKRFGKSVHDIGTHRLISLFPPYHTEYFFLYSS